MAPHAIWSYCGEPILPTSFSWLRIAMVSMLAHLLSLELFRLSKLLLNLINKNSEALASTSPFGAFVFLPYIVVFGLTTNYSPLVTVWTMTGQITRNLNVGISMSESDVTFRSPSKLLLHRGNLDMSRFLRWSSNFKRAKLNLECVHSAVGGFIKTFLEI